MNRNDLRNEQILHHKQSGVTDHG